MSYCGPTSLDLLATHGVVVGDPNAFITGEPSEYLNRMGIYSPADPSLRLDPNSLQRYPSKDNYTPEALHAEVANEPTPIADQYNVDNMTKEDKGLLKEPVSWKKMGAGALGLYLLGFILSKGKKNPINWFKPLGTACAWAKNKIFSFFKPKA